MYIFGALIVVEEFKIFQFDSETNDKIPVNQHDSNRNFKIYYQYPDCRNCQLFTRSYTADGNCPLRERKRGMNELDKNKVRAK